MDGVSIERPLVMALDALGYDVELVVHPRFVRMDVGVAICAHHTLVYMNVHIVLFCLFLVAEIASHLSSLHLPLHMPAKIDYLHVAAGTAISAVDGSGEPRKGDLVAVAHQAGGLIDGHSLLGLGKAGKREEKKYDSAETANEHDEPLDMRIIPIRSIVQEILYGLGH